MRSLCSKRFFPLFCHSAILQNGQTFLFVLCLCRVKISNSFLFVMELHDIPSSLLWSCHPRTETDRPSEGDRDRRLNDAGAGSVGGVVVVERTEKLLAARELEGRGTVRSTKLHSVRPSVRPFGRREGRKALQLRPKS